MNKLLLTILYNLENNNFYKKSHLYVSLPYLVESNSLQKSRCLLKCVEFY